jgi:hypothetical protein
MATINDKFQAQNGFESPKFSVDTAGKITTETLDVKTILLNGSPFVAYVPPEDQESDDTGTQVSNSFESLAVTGGIFKVNYLGNTAISVLNGQVTVNSIGVIPGSIDNVEIGYNTPSQIKVHTIDMAANPDSTASTINMNGASVKGDVNIANNVVLNNQPTVGTHATSKGYVDATATALAVAFGA